jgi:geranylgeranyl pyrophosphate synthase
MEIISSATAQTCEGELKQITQRGNWGLSEAEYISIIAEKTGAFFCAACALGAMQAGAGPAQVDVLSEYGRKTGIAFQITDDLLDLTGDQDKTGKPIGSDLNEHKFTLPVIRLLDVADKKDKELARKVLCEWQEKGRANNHHRKNLLTALRRYDCLSYAQKRAGEFVEQAVEAIKGLRPNSEADGLVEVARFVVNRVS